MMGTTATYFSFVQTSFSDFHIFQFYSVVSLNLLTNIFLYVYISDLAWTGESIRISKSYRIVCILILMCTYGLCIYTFGHCFYQYPFLWFSGVNLLNSHIYLMFSLLSPHCLHLLFCYVLSFLTYCSEQLLRPLHFIPLDVLLPNI